MILPTQGNQHKVHCLTALEAVALAPAAVGAILVHPVL